MRRRDPAYPAGTGNDRGSRLLTIGCSSVGPVARRLEGVRRCVPDVLSGLGATRVHPVADPDRDVHGPARVHSLRPAAAAPATQDEQAVRTVNLELILDLSGSMARDIGGGETRMEAAKRVMNDVIDALPEREGVNVGFRIYGHLGDNTDAAGTSAASPRSWSSRSRASTNPPCWRSGRGGATDRLDPDRPLAAAGGWRFSAGRRGGQPHSARHRW